MVACGGPKELKDFTKKFNENAYEFVAVDILKENDFGEIEEEKYGNWQTLYDLEGSYTIYAKYDRNNNIVGYNIHISGDEPYEELTGTGFEASQVIAETLELKRDVFIENYQKSLEIGEAEYQDGDYEITFYDFHVDEVIEHQGMTINFNKINN